MPCFRVSARPSSRARGTWGRRCARPSPRRVDTALATSVTYAKERFTFGRAIGSDRRSSTACRGAAAARNAYSLLVYAGPTRTAATCSLGCERRAVGRRSRAGLPSRVVISVHGGTATWEHDAPLFFRRAQLSRRLLGGAGDAAGRVAGELLSGRVRADGARSTLRGRGAIAQMGERLLCKQEVAGSIPAGSIAAAQLVGSLPRARRTEAERSARGVLLEGIVRNRSDVRSGSDPTSCAAAMEPAGIEPATSCLQSRRSPS